MEIAKAPKTAHSKFWCIKIPKFCPSMRGHVQLSQENTKQLTYHMTCIDEGEASNDGDK